MGNLAVTVDGKTFEIELNWIPNQGNHLQVTVEEETFGVIIPENIHRFQEFEWIIVNGRPYEINFDLDLAWIHAFGGVHRLKIRDLEAQVVRPVSGDRRVKAPIPGLIVRTLVEPGQVVEAGDPVIVLEAMKMENEIHATMSGIVSKISVQPGQTVLRNEVLVEVSEPP